MDFTLREPKDFPVSFSRFRVVLVAYEFTYTGRSIKMNII